MQFLSPLIKQTGTFTGEDMGKLYETFGFPPILTKEICESKGFIMDINEFDSYMERHKIKSKS